MCSVPEPEGYSQDSLDEPSLYPRNEFPKVPTFVTVRRTLDWVVTFSSNEVWAVIDAQLSKKTENDMNLLFLNKTLYCIKSPAVYRFPGSAGIGALTINLAVQKWELMANLKKRLMLNLY